jgi:hypothetical protein
MHIIMAAFSWNYPQSTCKILKSGCTSPAGDLPWVSHRLRHITYRSACHTAFPYDPYNNSNESNFSPWFPVPPTPHNSIFGGLPSNHVPTRFVHVPGSLGRCCTAQVGSVSWSNSSTEDFRLVWRRIRSMLFFLTRSIKTGCLNKEKAWPICLDPTE